MVKNKNRRLLCVLISVIMLMPLIVLPLADIEDPYDIVDNTCLEEVALIGEVEGSERVEETVGEIATEETEVVEGEEVIEEPEVVEGEEVIEEPEVAEGEEEIEEPEVVEGEEVIEEPEVAEGEEEIEEPEVAEGEEVIEEPEVAEGEDATEETEVGEGEEAIEEPEVAEGEEAIEEPEVAEGEEVIEEPEVGEGEEAIEEPEVAEGEEATEEAEKTEEEVIADKEQIPCRNTYVFEDENIIAIAVFSDAAAIPDVAELYVMPITEDTDNEQYNVIKDKVNDSIEAENQSVTSFLAYDIYFMADEIKYEPELGNVNVTLQYKNHIFNEEIKRATDEIKVLHLEETDLGLRVEDVTQEVGVINLGEETNFKISDTDTVEFVTDRFSTFIVTGVSTSSSSTINVTMQFVHANGAVDSSITGTYYLNITGSSNHRYNAALTVANGIATMTITGLYDQNGATKANGSLYSLTNGHYTAVLFQYPSACAANFRWDQNYVDQSGCSKYELGSEIIENYIITEFSKAIAITSGSGPLLITATAKSGTLLSRTDILSALSPVRPYSVFATQFDLIADMEGCIAVQKANLNSNFGNSHNNTSSYQCATIRTMTVEKIYYGTVQKTFNFGLYQDNNLVMTNTITLPTSGGGNIATATFTVTDTTSNYSVYELGEDNAKLSVGDNYNGYSLTSMEEEASTSSSTINNISYINTILSSNSSPLRQGTTEVKNCLVVGADYTISSEANNVYVYRQTQQVLSAENAYCDISVVSGSFPIDFDATLSEMSNLSVALAGAISSDTVMVKNMTIAELNSKNNNELTINTNGKLLLINIDATGATEISLSANAKLVVNGENCAGWSNQANNIIINIFTKSGDTYSSYNGNITRAGYMMGTLLVPRANVTDLSQNFNGNIVAAYVRNQGGEIHGNTMGTTMIDTVYKFINVTPLDIILPETGSGGTHIIYVVGLGIILLSSVLILGYQILRNTKGKPSNSSE